MLPWHKLCDRLSRTELPLASRLLTPLLASSLFLFLLGCGAEGAQTTAPSAVFSLTTLSFGATTVGSTATATTVTLSNAGGQPLLLSSYVLSDTTNFNLTTTCGPTLAPNASCAFTIAFRPQAASPMQAALTLTDNSGGAPNTQQIITLTGTGTPIPLPQAALTPLSLTFAPTVLKNTSPAQVVTLTNSGTAPLSLTSATLSDTADFNLTSTCPTTLAPAATCTYTLTSQPGTLGPLTATLTLTDNSGGVSGAQQTIHLTGTGLPIPLPQAALTPATLTFPQTILHTTTPAQSLNLTNSGTAPLTLTSITLSDTSDFTLTSTCPSSLAPAATCTVSIAFQPGTVGPLNASITFTDNSGGAPGTQQNIPLVATGLPIPLARATITPATLPFASTVIGASTAAQTILLSNTGTAPLALTGIILEDPANYTLTNACGPNLPAGASCSLAVIFHPQTTGALPSTLTLTDNSGLPTGTTQQTIALTGTGLPIPLPQASVSPIPATFGSVTITSTTAPQIFTLTNSGTAPLAISSITLSDPVNYNLTNSCGPTLPPSTSCTFTVTFQPQTTGALPGSLTITDNSGSTPNTQQLIALTGTGVPLPAPQASLSPSSLTFPDTMITTTATPQMVTLSNTGNAPLTLTSLVLSDTQNFTLTSNCAASLAPNTSCTLSLGFGPQTTNPQHATVTLTDNSGSASGTAQQNLTLNGNGIPFTGPRAALSPSTLTFPQTITNASAPPQSVTLTSTGTTALTITGLTLTGPAAAAFSLNPGACVGQLPVGASCTATVTYSPTFASQADVAALVFTDNSQNQANATQTAALTGSALAEVDSVTNFGDSITCGFYAQPNDGTGLVWSLEGYAGLFDTFLSVPALNSCRQGDTAADLSRLWVPFHSTPTANGNQLYTLMIGANDAYRYGIPASSLQTYSQEVGAALAWLAIPNTDKVLANTITQQTGIWTPDVNFGLLSTDPTASLTFPINQAVAGRNLYLVYHVWALPYGQAGKANIAIDGTTQATVDESQNSLVNIPTENGTQDTFLVQTVPLGAAGPHTITFSSAGPAGSQIGLLWAGTPQADYRTVDGAPRVLIGLITNSPSGNQTFAADIYNLQLTSLIPALAADGMNLTIVPTSRVLDPNTDFNDILHPNTAGHAKLAATFEQYR